MTRSFRVRPFVRRGTAATIPEVWDRYGSIEDARAGAKRVCHNERVVRVMLVDHAGAFVEWVER
jgi:hypothetical protein